MQAAKDAYERRNELVHSQINYNRGRMSEADFCDFVFTNPVSLHARMNPAFFDGTRCEPAVRELLARRRRRGARYSA